MVQSIKDSLPAIMVALIVSTAGVGFNAIVTSRVHDQRITNIEKKQEDFELEMKAALLRIDNEMTIEIQRLQDQVQSVEASMARVEANTEYLRGKAEGKP